MSRYLAFPDQVYKDRALLLAALAALGYHEVEEAGTGEALPLYGYRGDRRPETAALVVRRRHLGRASNDLGFALTTEGYVPIVSEYDRAVLQGGRLLPRLRAAYNEGVVEEVKRRLRGTAQRTVQGHVVKVTVRC